MKEERIRFCGLKEREVINICDCKRLGFVADLQINICSGCVEALIVPGPGRICGFLGYDAEYIIPFECILFRLSVFAGLERILFLWKLKRTNV